MDQRESKLVEFDEKFRSIQPSFDLPVVKGHLIFLKAFVCTAEAIDHDFAVKDPDTGVKSPSPPMHAFLSKAVHRYHVWVTKALQGRPDGPLALNEIPPLDVLFILHAHMIAPSRFDEDVSLHFPELGNIGQFPLSDVVSQIDVETGRYEHSPEQVATWERLTSIPFEPSNVLGKSGIHLSPPFSTDLVYKSLLQADFGTRLAHRGLFDQSFLLDKEATLGVFPRLYQAFLKLVLIPTMPRVFPSPPVDLIWHTHQLLGLKYKAQVLDLVGVFVDHISMEQIAPTETEFEEARRAWKAFLEAEGVELTAPCYFGNQETSTGTNHHTCTASGSQLFPDKVMPPTSGA